MSGLGGKGSDIIAVEVISMPAVTVRNLSEETHRALRVRAALKGHSTEAEIRAILNDAVASQGRLLVGSALAEFGRQFGGIELDITRDPRPTEPTSFE
jgi:plasmid stability protein